MSAITMNQACKFDNGTVIQGKWHKQRYRIVRTLGYGATGIVYLTDGPNGAAAVKISENSTAITSEVNVLKHFTKVQGSILGPSLLDVDDWEDPFGKKLLHFYAMEYVQGEDLLTFIEKHGQEWLYVFIIQLLGDLQKLHEAGWVFGDLKPENVLITALPPKIRWLDVGGTTLQGRAIKEYTEFFDRGYWGLGSRKAEPSYDLFCVAMIIINVAYPKRFVKKGDGYEQLVVMINKSPVLTKYKSMLQKALKGEYKDAKSMKEHLLLRNTRSKEPIKQRPVQTKRKSVKAQSATRIQKHQQSNNKQNKWETAVLCLFITIMYFIYVYINLL